MWRNLSIKRRLLGLSLLAMSVGWLIAAGLTYRDARHELNEVLDAHLAQASMLLVAQASHELHEVETEHHALPHKYSQRVAFQIWEDGTQLRLRSANAPDRPLSLLDNGYSDTIIHGQHWRVYSTWDDTQSLQIHVAERAEMREQLARSIATNLLLPQLLTLPLLALLLWFAVSRGLQPLAGLTREIALRAPDNLTPLQTNAVPREVTPLIERLNHLFACIQTSIENERRFTDDAAHELRTPIAAIKAQAQVASAAQDNTASPVLKNALNGVVNGCDRASHLIEQLLTLARLASAHNTTLEACPLRALAAEVLAEMAPAALDKGIGLSLEDSEEISVSGLPALLRIMLRNLIDNAVRYTPQGTQVKVAISKNHSQAEISVCDDGAGLPKEELEKITQRFYRPLGTQASGSGLGLSIVKRIAEIHHATLAISAGIEAQGLCIKIDFKEK